MLLSSLWSLLLFGLSLLLELVKLGLLFIDFFLTLILDHLLRLFEHLNLVLFTLILFIFLFFVVLFFGLVGPLIDIFQLCVLELLHLRIAVFGHFVHFLASFDGLRVTVNFTILIELSSLLDLGLLFFLMLLSNLSLHTGIRHLSVLVELQLFSQCFDLSLHFLMLFAP